MSECINKKCTSYSEKHLDNCRYMFDVESCHEYNPYDYKSIIRGMESENKFLRDAIIEIIKKFEDRESFVMLGPAAILSIIGQLKTKLKILVEELEK